MARKTLQWRYKLKKPRLDNPPEKIKQLWKRGMLQQASDYGSERVHGRWCPCRRCCDENHAL